MSLNIGSFAIKLAVEAAGLTAGLREAAGDLKSLELVTARAAAAITADMAKVNSDRFNLHVEGLDDLQRAQAAINGVTAAASASKSARVSVDADSSKVAALISEVRKVAGATVKLPVLPTVAAAAPSILTSVAAVSNAGAISETVNLLKQIPERTTTAVGLEVDEQSRVILEEIEQLRTAGDINVPLKLTGAAEAQEQIESLSETVRVEVEVPPVDLPAIPSEETIAVSFDVAAPQLPELPNAETIEIGYQVAAPQLPALPDEIVNVQFDVGTVPAFDIPEPDPVKIQVDPAIFGEIDEFSAAMFDAFEQAGGEIAFRIDPESFAEVDEYSTAVFDAIQLAGGETISIRIDPESFAEIDEYSTAMFDAIEQAGGEIAFRIDPESFGEVDEYSAAVFNAFEQADGETIAIHVNPTSLQEVDEWSAAVFDAFEQAQFLSIEIPAAIEQPVLPEIPDLPPVTFDLIPPEIPVIDVPDVSAEVTIDVSGLSAVSDARKAIDSLPAVKRVDVGLGIDSTPIAKLAEDLRRVAVPTTAKIDLASPAAEVGQVRAALDAAPVGFGRRLLDSIRTAKEATTASLGAAYNNFTPKPIKFALDKSAEFIGAGLDKLGERYGAGWKKAILTAAAISVPFALPPTLVAAEAARALGYAGKQAVAAAPVPTVEPQLLKTASQVEQAAKLQGIPLPVMPAVDIAGLAKAAGDVQQAIKATPVMLPITPALSGNAGSVVINAADEMRLAIEKAAGFASIRPFEGLIRQAGQFRESLGLLGTEEKVVHDGLTQLLASLAQAKQNPFSPAAKSLEAIGLQAGTLANLRIDQSLQQIFDALRKIDDVRLREDLAQKLLGAGFGELEATLGKVGGLKLPEVKLVLNARDSAEKAVRDLKDVFGGALDKLFSGDISGAISGVIKGTLGFAKGLAKDVLGQIGKDAAAAFLTGGLPAALEAGAAGASQAVAGLSAGLTALGTSIPVIGQIALGVLAVAAAATLLNNYVQSAFANTLGLLKQAQALGVAGQRSLEVGHAFARAGADINEVGPSLNRFAKFLGDVKLDPNGAQAQSLRRLGLDAEQLARTPLPEALGQVGDALNGLGDRALQAHFASEIFGRGWADLQGVFRRGSAGFQEAAAEYRRFAGVISATDAERVKSAARTGQIAAAQRAAVNQGVQVRTAVAFAPAIENAGRVSQALNEFYRLGGRAIGDLMAAIGTAISVVSHFWQVWAVGIRAFAGYYQILYAVGRAMFLIGSPIAIIVRLLSQLTETDAFKDLSAIIKGLGSLISDLADEVTGFFDGLVNRIPTLQSFGDKLKELFKPQTKDEFRESFRAVSVLGEARTNELLAAFEAAQAERQRQEAQAVANVASINTRLPPELFRNTTLRRPDRLAERLSQTPLIEPVREQADSAQLVAKQLEALAEQIQLTTQLRSEAERLGLVRVNATQQELDSVKDLVEFQLRNAAAIRATAGAAERLQAFARARGVAQATIETQNTTAEFRRQADELQRSTELMAILIGQGLSFEQIQRRLEQQKQVDSLVRRNAPQAEIVQLREAFRVANPAAELNAATQEATRQVASLQATTRRLQIVVDLRREALAAGENLADVENRINAEADRRLLIERGIADEVDRQLQAAQRGAQADEERIRLLGEANRIIQANRQADAGAAFDDQLKKIEELVQLGELQRSQADLAIGRHFLDFERTLGQQPGLPTQVLSSQTVEGLRSAAAQRAGLNSPTDPQERVVQAMERSRQTQEQMAAYLRELAVNARRRRTEETVAGGDF